MERLGCISAMADIATTTVGSRANGTISVDEDTKSQAVEKADEDILVRVACCIERGFTNPLSISKLLDTNPWVFKVYSSLNGNWVLTAVQVLHRTYGLIENFSTSFGELTRHHLWWTSKLTIVSAALYFIGGVRVTFSTGIASGGNLAYWSAILTNNTTSINVHV